LNNSEKRLIYKVPEFGGKFFLFNGWNIKYRKKSVRSINTDNFRQYISESLEFHSWNFDRLKSVSMAVLSLFAFIHSCDSLFSLSFCNYCYNNNNNIWLILSCIYCFFLLKYGLFTASAASQCFSISHSSMILLL
jgi:hypothetical protein